MSGVSASPSFALFSRPSKNPTFGYPYALTSANPAFLFSSPSKLNKHPCLRFETATSQVRRICIRCNSTTRPGGPGSGDNESKNVLDAFFLGKALAEALSERIESTVGEFLSTIGRLQAEQQKQLQDFQVDVLEKAKKAKENAAREAMEAQGLVPKATKVETPATYGADSTTSSADPARSPSSPNSYAIPTAETGSDPASKGPAFGASDD